MCMGCQNVYCKNCTERWKKKDNTCPNRCNEPNYQVSKDKNNILSILKFKCQYCDTEFNYNDSQKHKEICCGQLIQTYEVLDNPFDANVIENNRVTCKKK